MLIIQLLFFSFPIALAIPKIQNDPYRVLLEKTYRSFESTDDDLGDPLILTPLLQQNKIDEARRRALVNLEHLMPGVESYAGYFTVNETFNGNLWFWYFPVMNKSADIEKTPLILWLQGGPGASSMYGLFEEIGPFTVTNNFTLNKKEYSWGDKYSLLFIDNPVGTGFSFTDEGGYAKDQETIGANLYSALKQFMSMFPELQRAPLVVAGESYAGKHVPSLAIQIHRNKHQHPPINMKGVAIGNGFIDPITLQSSSAFFREVGLLDDKTSEDFEEIEKLTAADIRNGETVKAFYEMSEGYFVESFESRLPNQYNFLSDNEPNFGKYMNFLNSKDIRKALHVGSTKFTQIGDVYHELIPDFMNSAKQWLEEILEHYKVLVYNGHLDTVVPYHASVNTYNSLKFSGADKYKEAPREPYLHNGKLIGYYKTADNFHEIMVRGAGHMVPCDKPSEALAIITKFVELLQ